MNYKKIYDKIIENRLNNPLDETEYGENHHIIPRSLGGSDEVENLVRLTAREHFICHALLAEMYEDGKPEWYKMNLAFKMMKASSDAHNGNRYFNSKLYELKRKDFSKVMSHTQQGKKNSQYDTIWIFNKKNKKSIKVHKSELDEYIKLGYVLGRNRHRKSKMEKIEQKLNKRIDYANNLFESFLKSSAKSVNEWARSGETKHSQQYLSGLWLECLPERYATKSKTQSIKNSMKIKSRYSIMAITPDFQSEDEGSIPSTCSLGIVKPLIER